MKNLNIIHSDNPIRETDEITAEIIIKQDEVTFLHCMTSEYWDEPMKNIRESWYYAYSLYRKLNIEGAALIIE